MSKAAYKKEESIFDAAVAVFKK
jgi:hypothetical protein